MHSRKHKKFAKASRNHQSIKKSYLMYHKIPVLYVIISWMLFIKHSILICLFICYIAIREKKCSHSLTLSLCFFRSLPTFQAGFANVLSDTNVICDECSSKRHSESKLYIKHNLNI